GPRRRRGRPAGRPAARRNRGGTPSARRRAHVPVPAQPHRRRRRGGRGRQGWVDRHRPVDRHGLRRCRARAGRRRRGARRGGGLMLAPQRQAAILERVRTDGAVRVSDLVAELGVSDMTMRRDLEVLADRGLVSKVHGGATAVQPGSTDEPEFAAKAIRQRAEKRAIAAAAAQLVKPGTAVALSAGTTTAELARRLTEVPELTVVTNSIPVADVFDKAGRTDQTVVLTGGVRTPSDALVGP